MPNEVGQKLYDITIKEILKSCRNREQKILADFILEKAPVTQIWNTTDVTIQSIINHPSGTEDLFDWIEQTTGIRMSGDECEFSADDRFNITKGELPGRMTLESEWTPCADDIFTYAKTNNGMYYVLLMHRLDDTKIIMFFGTTQEFQFTVFESITVEIDIFGVHVDYRHMFESVRDYIVRNGISDPKKMNFLFNSMHTCFLGYFSMLLKMFADLTSKDKPLRCYVDEEDNGRNVYYRSPLTKKVTKVGNKPIILVLHNDSEADTKARAYKRLGGKIHYAFSWVVRGHYRKLHNPKTLGLDRNGERCVPGYTWIETYVKGDENAPLLKRERVVLDRRA